MSAPVRNKVLLRGEESDTQVAVVESTMPAGAPGPPLHSHAFDEAFYVLDGKLTFQLGDRKSTAYAGELVFARRGQPHTLANPGDTPARYLLIITPAGFEHAFARRAPKEAGTNPPSEYRSASEAGLASAAAWGATTSREGAVMRARAWSSRGL